jgi:hypothetical protein
MIGIAGSAKLSRRSWFDWGNPLILGHNLCILILERAFRGVLPGRVRLNAQGGRVF